MLCICDFCIYAETDRHVSPCSECRVMHSESLLECFEPAAWAVEAYNKKED